MIIISGGTGLIGRNILKRLENERIILITRSKEKAEKIIGNLKSDIEFLDWTEILEERWIQKIRTEKEKIIINLAGENIGSPWRSPNKKLNVLRSRIESTERIVYLANNINAHNLINASAIGYYGDTGEEEKDENSPPGNMFLSDVCVKWENEAKKSKTPLTITRIGVVISKEAKIITSSLTPFFVINPFGKGENYISWIHIEDLTEIFLKCMKNEIGISGKTKIINCVAPQYTKAKEFIKTIAKIKKKPILNIPQFILEVILGKDFVSETIKVSQKIKSIYLQNNFKFKFPGIKEALENILSRS